MMGVQAAKRNSSSISRRSSILLTIISAVLLLPSLCRCSPPVGLKGIKAAVYSFSVIDFGSSIQLLLDLPGPMVWTTCSPGYTAIPCASTACTAAKIATSPPPFTSCSSPQFSALKLGCNCSVSTPDPTNTSTCAKTVATLADMNPIGFYMTKSGLVTGDAVLSVSGVVSACTTPGMEANLPATATGVAGLGKKSEASLISQLAAQLRIKRQFGLCLANFGAAFFGENPFRAFSLKAHVPKAFGKMTSTPLLDNPPWKPNGYFIEVAALAVDGTVAVKLPKTILQFDYRGYGGVELDSSVFLTKLRTDLYKPFVAAYKAALAKRRVALQVTPTSGYDVCVRQGTAVVPDPENYTRKIPKNIPQVDLILGKGGVWTISPANLFVSDGGADCLAFKDGGAGAERAIVVGLYQMQDTLMVFDLEKSRLEINPYLLYFSYGCFTLFQKV